MRRSMTSDAARPRKRRKEAAAGAEGWQPELQWGDSFSLPGLAVQNLTMEVPLAHEQPDGERITVFARMVSQPGRSTKPLLLFLQGLSPPTHPTASHWQMCRSVEAHRDVREARYYPEDTLHLLLTLSRAVGQVDRASSRLAHWTPADG